MWYRTWRTTACASSYLAALFDPPWPLLAHAPHIQHAFASCTQITRMNCMCLRGSRMLFVPGSQKQNVAEAVVMEVQVLLHTSSPEKLVEWFRFGPLGLLLVFSSRARRPLGCSRTRNQPRGNMHHFGTPTLLRKVDRISRLRSQSTSVSHITLSSIPCILSTWHYYITGVNVYTFKLHFHVFNVYCKHCTILLLMFTVNIGSSFYTLKFSMYTVNIGLLQYNRK